MKLVHAALLAAASSLLPAWVQAEPAPVSDLGDSLQQRLLKVEKQLASRNSLQVQMQQNVDALQEEVNQLRGAMELQAHQLDQVLKRQRELYQELERRLSAAPAQTASTPAATAAQDATDTTAALSESDAYQQALDLILKKKRYDQAIPALQQFIQTYPESSYSANAHYWLGQLLFNGGDSSGAKTAFNKVVTDYPGSAKVSDALLKLGMLEQLGGNTAQAKELYNRVLKEYPDSASAQIARSRLSSLK